MTLNSPASELRERKQTRTSGSPLALDVQFVSVNADTRSEVKRKKDKWARKERQETANQSRYEVDKDRVQRTIQKRAQASTLRDRQRQEAMRRLRRLKYKERVKKREADETEKAKLEAERIQKAERATKKRRLERRKTLASRLATVLQRESVSHEMKIESLVRGDPLFAMENSATGELVVQFSIDNLQRLQPGRWFNQEIVDWYLCVLTSDSKTSMSLGAEFHRQLLAKHQGPEFVADFHRPMALRGVREGERFCALEGMRVIFAPANPNGNHWVLMAIFPDQRKICCFDSLSPGPKGSSACQRIMKGIWGWVALHEKRRSGTMNGWSREMVQGLPRQTNTWNCGVHTCDFARMLSLDQPAGEPICTDEDSANMFRARLLVYALETALISY